MHTTSSPVHIWSDVRWTEKRIKIKENIQRRKERMTVHADTSSRLCPSTAGCSRPSVSSIVFCLLLSCSIFHLGFVHPLQDVALCQCFSIVFCLLLSCSIFYLGFVHPLQDVALCQCLPLSSVCCFPVPSFT